MTINLFITNSNNGARYWWTGDAHCHHCGGDMTPIGFHIRSWTGSGHQDTLLCHKCTDKVPELWSKYPLQERRSIIICDDVPPTAQPILPSPPTFADGRVNVFEATEHRHAPADKTTDKTQRAGRPGYTFEEGPVMIGADVRAELTSKDRALTTREATKLLEEQRRGDEDDRTGF